MSHPAQRSFIRSVRRKNPAYFVGCNVVDIGSKDINGNNKTFFWFCNYKGIDLSEGKNVDLIGRGHEVLPTIHQYLEPELGGLSTIISTEALEHDEHWEQTLRTAYFYLEPGGLLVITAGGDGREEHGTTAHHAWCSPDTNNYYQNISNRMFSSALPVHWFTEYHLRQRKGDVQFWGRKK